MVRKWRKKKETVTRGGEGYRARNKAERALGKSLPPFAVVHHAGKNTLVICEDQNTISFCIDVLMH